MSFLSSYKTFNPAFHRNFWERPSRYQGARMSLGGIILKSLAMLFLVTLMAVYMWGLFLRALS